MPTKKLKRREPNGRLSRSSELAVQACSPAQVRRLRDAALAGMQDPEWGTELGRLFLAGYLEPFLFEAGKRWMRLAEASQKAMDGPAMPTRSAFAERTGGKPADPGSDRGKRQVEHDRATVEDMAKARLALAAGDRMAEATVRSVCEDGEAAIGAGEREALARGLTLLAVHWGLAQKPKA